MDLSELFRRAAEEKLGTVEKETYRCQHEKSEDSIHDLRVAIRRFRALLSLLRSGDRPADAGLLRVIFLRLGEIRDIEVQATLIRSLGIPCCTVLADARDSRAVLMKEALFSDSLFIGAGAGYFEKIRHSLVHGQITQKRLDKVKDKRIAELQQAVGRAASLQPEDLHDLRIAAKKWRYNREAVALLGEPEIDFDYWKSVQDQLGSLHDLDILLESADIAQESTLRAKLSAQRKELLESVSLHKIEQAIIGE